MNYKLLMSMSKTTLRENVVKDIYMDQVWIYNEKQKSRRPLYDIAIMLCLDKQFGGIMDERMGTDL